MSAFLFDIDEALKEIKESSLGVVSGVKSLQKSFDQVTTSGQLASASVNVFGKAIEKAAISAKLLYSLYNTFSNIQEAANKFKVLLTIAGAANKTLRELKGFSESITFSEAILGSSKLADNVEYLGKVSSNVFNLMRISQEAVFDSENFNKWSSSAVAAYSQVEQAAYRLGTVTTAANERSIEKISASIKSTRELQAATNDALGTVELLNTQYDIASAGFTGSKENTQVGKASVNLAQAGFGDVGGSTNAVVRALRGLGEDASTAEKRAAQLFETTRVGLLTLDQLTPEVGTLAVASQTLGVSFAEMSASLAGLTTQGISASEASTKLQSLFAEVAEGSQTANQYLAKFRDDAGKPIQLNTTALREKGIGGLVADIQKATGGSQSALQQIFNRQESVEAVQLLGNLGQKELSGYTERIEGASGERLDEEAKGRQQTLIGAFEKGANTSQKQIEDFGRGVSETVLQNIAGTNEVLGGMVSKSAEGLGRLTGTLSTLATKFRAIAGFAGTVFSTILPFTFMAVVGKVLAAISKKFKELQKEGETPWITIKRVFLDFVVKAEDRFVQFIRKIKSEMASAREEFQRGLGGENGTPQAVPNAAEGGVDLTEGWIEKATTASTILDETDLTEGWIEKATTASNVISATESPFAKADREAQEAVAKLKQGASQAVSNVTSSVRESVARVTNRVGTVASNSASNVRSFIFSPRQRSPFVQNIIDRSVPVRNVLASGAGRASGVLSSFGINLPAIGNAAQGVGKLTGSFGKLAGTGLKAAAPLLKIVGSYMAGIAVAGGLAVVGLAVVAGWSSTLANSLDKRSIPAIKEMRESLLDLKNVEGLEEILKELDPIAGKAQKAGTAMDTLNRIVYNGQKLWNDLTGASYNYFNNILPTFRKVDEKLEASISKNVNNAKKGIFGAETKGGREAERKVNAGIELTSDDVKSLEDETEGRKRESEARVENQRRIIAEGRGKFKKKELEDEEKKLRNLEEQAKKEKEVFDTQLKQVKLSEALRRLKSVDTTTPLQLQITDQNEQAITNQITDIGKRFQSGVTGATKDANIFDKLTGDISGALSSIQTQVALDPTSAAKLRDDLVKAVPDFDKLIFSNPQLREKAAELNRSITEGVIATTRVQETTDTAVLQEVTGLGSQSTLANQAKYTAQLRSINTQVNSLNEELSKPETSLARQMEILSEIEQLEAKRISIDIESRINAETGGRKQTLTLSEQLLEVEKARNNLLSMESRFGSLSVSAAEAKLKAAKQELAVKKEQTAIANKEEIIRKEGLLSALRASAARETGNRDRITDGLSKEQILKRAESRKQATTTTADTEALNAVKQAEIEAQRIRSQKISFTDEERKLAKQAGVEKLLDKSGNLKYTAESTNKFLQKRADAFDGKATTQKPNLVGDALKESTKILDPAKNLLGGISQKSIETVKPAADVGTVLGKVGTSLTDVVNIATGRAAKAEQTKQVITLVNDKNTKIRTEAATVENAGKTKAENLRNSAVEENARTDRLAEKRIAQADRFEKRARNLRNVAGSELNAKNTVLDELTFTKAVAAVKEQLDSLTTQLSVLDAQVAKDFAQREKLLKRGDQLAESFNSIANSGAIFSNSVASASLSLAALESANKKGRLDSDAAQEIAKITGRVKILGENADLAEAVAAEGRARKLSPEAQSKLDNQAKEARQDSNKATKEANDDIRFVKTKTALDKIAAGLEESEAKIRKEFASRTRLIAINEDLASSFSSLSSTASSLFSNSSLGATLSRFSTEISMGSGKARKEYDEQSKLLNERNKALKEAVVKAKEAGADTKTVKRLEEAANTDDKQKPVEQAYLRQKLVLDSLNERLSIMSARVNEVSDILQKQAGISKDRLDFESRQRNLIAESNQSGRGLQSALVNAIGGNTPIADMINRRSDFQAAKEEGDVQKASNVTEAKKEIIDLTVQKQQLALEQQSYENALTQTQLLSDMVSLQKGGEAKFSDSAAVQERLNQLPSLINESRASAQERLNLTNQKLQFIPQELEAKNRNVDRQTLTRQLGIVGSGGTVDPAMLSEFREVLTKARKDVGSFRPESIRVGSLNDADFQKDLARLNPGKEVMATQPRNMASSQRSIAQPNTVISTPVNIQLSVSGSDASKFDANLQQNLKQMVSSQINIAMGNLSKQLLASSKKI